MRQRTYADFSETNEGARRHVFVSFLVSLFLIARKSREALDASKLLCCGKVIGGYASRRFPDNFRVADHTREPCRWQSAEPEWMLLTNSDLSAHSIDQLLGIVADPGLKHCLDVLDLLNSF